MSDFEKVRSARDDLLSMTRGGQTPQFAESPNHSGIGITRHGEELAVAYNEKVDDATGRKNQIAEHMGVAVVVTYMDGIIEAHSGTIVDRLRSLVRGSMSRQDS